MTEGITQIKARHSARIAKVTKADTDKKIAGFTKSDDFGKLKDRDLAIDAGELGSPIINRGKTIPNTQGFASKPTNLSKAKVAIDRQYDKAFKKMVKADAVKNNMPGKVKIQKVRAEMRHADGAMLKNKALEIERGVLRKEAVTKGVKLNPGQLKSIQKGNTTATKIATKKLGNNLSLQDVKMNLRKQYAAQGKDVDVYFHQASSPGLTKRSFKPGAHAETGQAGTYVHMGDKSFDAVKGTYGKNTHAVIVDRKAGRLIQGKRSYPGGSGEFAEAFVKPNQIVEIQDVTKNLRSSPGPKVAAKRGNVTMSQIKQARKKFESSGSAADRKKLQALADKFRGQ